MAASDDLKKLSDRAKTAEDHAAAARNQARAELEQSVTGVRNSAEAGAKKLQAKTQAAGPAGLVKPQPHEFTAEGENSLHLEIGAGNPQHQHQQCHSRRARQQVRPTGPIPSSSGWRRHARELIC